MFLSAVVPHTTAPGPRQGHAEGGPAAEPRGDRAEAARAILPRRATSSTEHLKAPQSFLAAYIWGLSSSPPGLPSPKSSETHFPSVCDAPRSSNRFSMALPSFGTKPSFAALHLRTLRVSLFSCWLRRASRTMPLVHKKALSAPKHPAKNYIKHNPLPRRAAS